MKFYQWMYVKRGKFQKYQNAQYCSTYLHQNQVPVQQFHHLIGNFALVSLAKTLGILHVHQNYDFSSNWS